MIVNNIHEMIEILTDIEKEIGSNHCINIVENFDHVVLPTTEGEPLDISVYGDKINPIICIGNVI